MWEETQHRKRRCPVFTYQHYYRLFSLLLLYSPTGLACHLPPSPHHQSTTGMLTSLHYIASNCARRLPAHPGEEPVIRYRAVVVMYSRPALSLSHCTRPPTHLVPTHTHTHTHTIQQ
jgi:hypothetical protein